MIIRKLSCVHQKIQRIIPYPLAKINHLTDCTFSRCLGPYQNLQIHFQINGSFMDWTKIQYPDCVHRNPHFFPKYAVKVPIPSRACLLQYGNN